MKYDHNNKEMLPEYSRMLPIRSLINIGRNKYLIIYNNVYNTLRY